MAFSCEQLKVKPSDPIQWDIKKRPSSSRAEFKIPKGLTPKNTSGTASATTKKMSHASWASDDPLEHNWLEEDPPLEDFAQPPSSYVDDCSTDSEDGESQDNPEALRLQINKLERKR